MRKFTKLAIAVASVPLVLMLAGCGVTSGKIIEKQHLEAFDHHAFFPHATWSFEIQGPDDKGKTDTSWVYVDESVYNAHQKGEFFDSKNADKKR